MLNLQEIVRNFNPSDCEGLSLSSVHHNRTFSMVSTYFQRVLSSLYMPFGSAILVHIVTTAACTVFIKVRRQRNFDEINSLLDDREKAIETTRMSIQDLRIDVSHAENQGKPCCDDLEATKPRLRR